MPSLRICLVGPDQQENLALGYLAAAVERAGHRAELVPFAARQDIDRAVCAVLAADPDVVGLGIAFQYCIDDYLSLVSTLRERGYRGHVTCGGHVPTFCYAELLRDAPGLDTAVRHEGEQTLVELLERLGQGRTCEDLAGLAWRRGSEVVVGPPRPAGSDLDSLPWPARRDEPYVVGGLPIAFLITARGCVGDCAYCSIGAFAADAGGPRFRMRSAEAVADEVAGLCAERAVRVVFLQDDLFLLPSERQTVERLHALSAALAKRGIDDVAFWIKGRPESITPAMLTAAQQLGAIHLFLGVESASAERLAYLGRTHSPEDNRRAIALCREHGVRPSFNLMLFDPDCTLEDVAITLDFAAQHADLPWNVCRTEIYSGTRLQARLAAEARLEGDYRSYGYRMRDARAEIMFRILRVCLHERAFAFDSLLNRLISLSFARQMHERFLPGPATEQLSLEVEHLILEAHRDTVDCLRMTLDFSAGQDAHARERARRFAVRTALEVQRRDHSWRRQVDRLWQQLHARGIARSALQ